ncbi:MAG: DUF2066 domain-containing protein [Proteobacteria bacterium]|nr:DUF2066 domain-containing protein [Pseudomonadota bacterium]
MLHRLFRPISFAIVLFWCAIALSISVGARAADIFTVNGVPVDARAEDELKAKAAGIARGQEAALRQLLRSITLRADHDRLPVSDGKAVTQLVRDYSIETEKFGGGRYIASLTTRFKADAVRALLRQANIPYAETASQPVLVLPVFQTGGVASLWDDPNPWFAAWPRERRNDGLLPLVMPVGDLPDIAVIGAQQALEGQADRLVEIGTKYDTRNVMVVAATLQINPGDGAMQLETVRTMYHDGMPKQTGVRRFTAASGEERDAFLAGAARALADEANESWKRDNLLGHGNENSMALYIPLNSLGNWLDIRGRLGGIAGMKQVRVTRLTVSFAEVTLSYVGNPAQLRLAMAQQNLDLRYDAQDARWTLHADGGN